MISLSHKITEYFETRSEAILQDIKKGITEIEVKELRAIFT
jgi:hypothetical protein